jgi:hypothetical protein
MVYGLLFGGLAGCVLGGASWGLQGWLPIHWRTLFLEHHFPLVVGLYGVYSAIAFINQALARYLFARQQGWLYASSLLLAYLLGTVVKLGLAPLSGIVALPLGAVISEGAAMLLLSIRVSRNSASTEHSVMSAPSSPSVGT